LHYRGIAAHAVRPTAARSAVTHAQARCRYALIDDTSEIEVDASEGTVTLTGHVATWAEHDMVIGAAWMGIGVKAVRDDLIVIG
jgi:osmotically-inducible protein OsmY